ncbi:lactosylceramide 1,3-N-acetyl-beta-D-glucosaminyltransferase-like isoform X3 [Watersipora subatra]|uniref:lactosylceramide 1,3-N-acetyl-beta-D-glucosaminyltransferase-like isoform X3 n=1 Tax=Watersipora subatra TaxID=2589382 RepID=UPI00355BAC3F
MLLRLALELLCIITSVTSDRYQLVPRPLDSVIPERFYEQNGRVNQPPLITLTEPETIQNEPLYMLIIVRSSSHHFQRRDAIRLTWGNVSDTAEGRVSLVFVVGKSADPTVHSLLLLESQQHKDLLYVGFEDTYANLTLKDLAVFQYARKLMAHCQYLAIAGDEIVLDISGVVQFLADAYDDVAINQHQSEGVRELSICYEFPCCTPVIRENSSKYLVQNGYYEGTLYPSYCSGTFFVIHMGLVGEIYNMMLDTPFFMPDDVWLGIIYQKLGIRLHDSHLNFAGISSYKRNRVIPNKDYWFLNTIMNPGVLSRINIPDQK